MPDVAVTAHVAGVPVEEMAPLAYGAGAAWIALRLMVWRFLRRDRRRSSR